MLKSPVMSQEPRRDGMDGAQDRSAVMGPAYSFSWSRSDSCLLMVGWPGVYVCV